jgi:hypothetical protein
VAGFFYTEALVGGTAGQAIVGAASQTVTSVNQTITTAIVVTAVVVADVVHGNSDQGNTPSAVSADPASTQFLNNVNKGILPPIVPAPQAPLAANPGTSSTVNTGGQTAAGHPTDAYGNKLGASGKPQVNTVKHSTRKGAKDAARNEGKGAPVNHTNPQKGGDHYPPTDENGEKLPNSTHHEYPS